MSAFDERFQELRARHARIGSPLASLKFEYYSKYNGCKTVAMKLNAFKRENETLRKLLGSSSQADSTTEAKDDELVKKYLEPVRSVVLFQDKSGPVGADAGSRNRRTD